MKLSFLLPHEPLRICTKCCAIRPQNNRPNTLLACFINMYENQWASISWSYAQKSYWTKPKSSSLLTDNNSSSAAQSSKHTTGCLTTNTCLSSQVWSVVYHLQGWQSLFNTLLRTEQMLTIATRLQCPLHIHTVSTSRPHSVHVTSTSGSHSVLQPLSRLCHYPLYYLISDIFNSQISVSDS